MERELVEEHIGRKAARRVRIGRQRRDLGAGGHFDLKGAMRAGIAAPVVGLQRVEHETVGGGMALDAFVHRLGRLTLAA